MTLLQRSGGDHEQQAEHGPHLPSLWWGQGSGPFRDARQSDAQVTIKDQKEICSQRTLS